MKLNFNKHKYNDDFRMAEPFYIKQMVYKRTNLALKIPNVSNSNIFIELCQPHFLKQIKNKMIF